MSQLLTGLRRLRMTYKQYLQSDHWLDVRRRFYEAHPKKCRVCGTTKGINLHHMTYERLGAERLTDLVPLCKDHHETYHKDHPGFDAIRQSTKRFIRKTGLPAGVKRKFDGKGYVSTITGARRKKRTAGHHESQEEAIAAQKELDQKEREKQERISQVKFNPSVPDWQKELIEKMLTKGHKSGIAWRLAKYRIGTVHKMGKPK